MIASISFQPLCMSVLQMYVCVCACECENKCALSLNWAFYVWAHVLYNVSIRTWLFAGVHICMSMCLAEHLCALLPPIFCYITILHYKCRISFDGICKVMCDEWIWRSLPFFVEICRSVCVCAYVDRVSVFLCLPLMGKMMCKYCFQPIYIVRLPATGEYKYMCAVYKVHGVSFKIKILWQNDYRYKYM